MTGETPTEDLSDSEGSADVRPQRRSFLRELPLIIVGALVVAVLVKSFLIQVFYIPSASMLETLQLDDKVTVSKLAYRSSAPQRGDIVVFENEGIPSDSLVGVVVRNLKESFGQQDPSRHLIKRVVGLPGETIEIRDGVVIIDGEPIEEDYLNDSPHGRDFAGVVIPDGHYFVMGDNRNSSRDSRVFGPIDGDRIIGKAIAIVWPPTHWAGL